MKEDYDKVVKTICKIGDMNIKHIVNKNIWDKSTGKYSKTFVLHKNNSSRAGINNLHSIYIENTFDKIILESSENVKSDSKTFIPRPMISFGYGDFTNLKITFDEVFRWFKDERFRNNLFQYTKDGKPYGISSNYKTLNVKFRSHGGFINNSTMQIEPAVVSANMNVETYPGVLIRGATGVIGRCSLTELAELKDILLDLVRNLYQNSLLLSIVGGMNDRQEDIYK